MAKNIFKKKEVEPEEEPVEPTLQEQMTELEEKLLANTEAWQLADSELNRVRANIDSESSFIESDIQAMKKDHQGSAKSFLDKLLKKRVSDSTHATQTAKKLEAHLRVLRRDQNILRRDREQLQKLIDETADRELSGEIIGLLEKFIEVFAKELYPTFVELKTKRSQIDPRVLIRHIIETFKKPGVYAHILTSRMKTEYLNDFSVGELIEAGMQVNMDTPDGKPLLKVAYSEYLSSKHVTEEAFVVGDSYAIERKPA